MDFYSAYARPRQVLVSDAGVGKHIANHSYLSARSNEIISTSDVLGWDKHRHSDCDRRKAGLGVFLIVEAGVENSLLECSIGAGYTRVPVLLSGWQKTLHLAYRT